MEKFKESKEIRIEFEKELRLLLTKWNAEMMIENIGVDYFEDSTIRFIINSNWIEGRCVSEYTEIDLGSYVS